MSGRLKHRPVSSSRSARSTQSTEKGINGLPSANQQQPCAKKRTRSRTDSGERLKEEDKPTIKAVGEHWEVHPYQGSRKPPTVIGALVREMYPDVVDTAKGPKPVLTWEDYKQTSTCGEPNDKRVVKEFWWRFKCHPEDRAEADALLEKKFKNMVRSMLSEEKQAVIKKLYSNDNVPPEDVDGDGNRWPTKEALIDAKPTDFTTSEGWALLCEHWSTPKFRKSSLQGKTSRGDELYHHGGSRSLTATCQYLVQSADPKPF
ncbi:hypothetical protein HU200_036059 [Digitaria exilis]|uniref:Uncharacterized protein n=1 Tax=Digitaria exilis TaxID=1010633 RepID=A0A835BGX6_9POAL|nr:hypothetical protein HU200_036059 [Digitaria exilis]